MSQVRTKLKRPFFSTPDQTRKPKKLRQLSLSYDRSNNPKHQLKSVNQVERENLNSCSDINLEESVKKQFLRKYRQNLFLARHYLKQYEVDIKEAKLIDQASLESEKEKDIMIKRQKEKFGDLYKNGTLQELKKQCFPSSNIIDIPEFEQLIEDNREICIKILQLEKQSLKFYPSSPSYYQNFAKDLHEIRNKSDRIKYLMKRIDEISSFLFVHPDEKDPLKQLFSDEKITSTFQISDDGVIEIL